MSVEVRIPKEITEYKEKILLGMSVRQLVCFSSAVIIAIGSYFLYTKLLGINNSTAGDIVLIEIIPLMMLGFFKKMDCRLKNILYYFLGINLENLKGSILPNYYLKL